MQRFILRVLSALVLTGLASPCWALCEGRTVAQEFREADLVIRARLVSQIDAWDDDPSPSFKAQWGDPSTEYTAYGLRLVEVFKGKPQGRVRVFEEHNSGAFYLDIDKDYLLFLKRLPKPASISRQARGAYYVPYTCGQSMPMAEVKPQALAELRELSGR
jgi:hypothetical protein